ncbi:MAG: SRPBCC domain-containing protein [Flavobacterium sp.]|nr:SRPBCC domain-containing protein [Flavobacterium sp.]
MSEKIISVERVFKADKKVVWRAITEKDLMKLWYFDLQDFKTVIGFKFEFMGGPEDGIQYKHLCQITEVLPEKKLTYSWKYEGFEGVSYVTFELFDEDENTKVILTHIGFDTFPSSNPDFAIANFEEGWNHIINTSLKAFLEKNI